MKILIDVNLSPAWADFLSKSGHDAVHWSGLGSPSAEDAVLLEYAAANGFVILTHDLDYGALLAHRGDPLPSVVQLRLQDVVPAAAGEAVVKRPRRRRGSPS